MSDRETPPGSLTPTRGVPVTRVAAHGVTHTTDADAAAPRAAGWAPRQATSTATGGAHAPAVSALAGALPASADDVGRHNAVDKSIGALLLGGAGAGIRSREVTPAVLMVSGRVS